MKRKGTKEKTREEKENRERERELMLHNICSTKECTERDREVKASSDKKQI